MRRELDYDETAEAVRARYQKHGRLPVSGEWERAAAGHPAARSIRRRWGWREFLASAVHAGEGEVPGLQRARRGGAGGIVRTDDNLLTDLIAFNVKSGRWPTHKE
jgi:hypothetical protein